MQPAFEFRIPQLHSLGFSDDEILFLGTYHSGSTKELLGSDPIYVKESNRIKEVDLTDENRKVYIQELLLQPGEDNYNRRRGVIPIF
jgi:hypothetical protein